MSDWINGKFARVPADVLTSRPFRELSDGAIRVYLVLALHADDGGKAWPGQDRLGEMTGLTRRAVQNGITSLAASGLVNVIRGCGRSHHSIYLLKGAPTNAVPTNAVQTNAVSGGTERAHGEVERAHVDDVKGARTNARTDQNTPTEQTIGTDQIAVASQPPAGLSPGGDVLTHAAPSFADALTAGSVQCGEGQGTLPFTTAMTPAPAADWPGKSSSADQPRVPNNDATGAGKTASAPSKRKKRASVEERAVAKAAADVERIAVATWACRSLENMTNYLLYGEAARSTPLDQLPPMPTNWRTALTVDGRADCERWTNQQWQGFYWWRVCRYREAVGLPLSMPDWGRLGNSISARLFGGGGAANLFTLIDFMTCHFQAIQHRIGGPFGANQSLDSVTLDVRQVTDAAVLLMAGESRAVLA